MKDDQRSWLSSGILVIAALAAFAMAVTVFVARRGLSHAYDVVVRGEADALVSAVIADLAQDPTPGDAQSMQREVDTLASRGLRYVALFEREGRLVAEAGDARMRDAKLRPGERATLDRRVRVVQMMPPRWRPPREGEPGHPRGPLFLAIELEPPIIQELNAHLTRVAVVAVIASGVLVALAVAWSRSAARLAAIERKAAREQRLVALGSMSSVMAHELRNPLASLKGHAQLLAEDLEGKQKSKAERVVAEAQRLEALTTSLLDFVRDGPIERSETTANALIDRALQDLARDRVRIDVGDERLAVDEARLARAVHNLVDNALQASAGDVEVSVRNATITVRDHGPGLPDANIFEPFVTTRTRGTGLGLPVARRIAEQHGGTLSARNHPDGGAEFTLRLPQRLSQDSA